MFLVSSCRSREQDQANRRNVVRVGGREYRYHLISYSQTLFSIGGQVTSSRGVGVGGDSRLSLVMSSVKGPELSPG